MEQDAACDIISKLPDDVVFYIFEMDISKNRSIPQILEKADIYDECFAKDQNIRRTTAFYGDRGWKIIFKTIGRMILFYAPRSIVYGEIEEGFIPSFPFPDMLFTFVSIPSDENSPFKIFNSWNKYRIAWGRNNGLYLLDNNSKDYLLGTNIIFDHSTLYFVFIDGDELKLFLDKPWIDAYAIFRMKVNKVPRRNLSIKLKETIYGLMLIFHETENIGRGVILGYETVYKIDLTNKVAEIIFEDSQYESYYSGELFEESSAYLYGSSMILYVKEESSGNYNFVPRLTSYDGKVNYTINKELEISSIETTGLVGYDVVYGPGFGFLMDENGDEVRENPNWRAFTNFIYFESFAAGVDGSDVEISDLITGESFVRGTFSNPGDIFMTRKDDKTGYFVWVKEK